VERNRLKRKLAAGELGLISGNYENADMIDFIGSLGVVDAVWIDMEHSPVTWSGLADMSRAADLWGMTSIVRVRDNDPTLISLTLGEGIDGVIVPHVNTREEAERVVDGALFDPLGHRGTSGGRKSYGKSNHYGTANDDTFIAVMIEDIVAVENLPEILRVPNIDVFYVSHHDLSQSMGLLNDAANPKIHETYDRAIKMIVDAGKVAGGTVTERDLGTYLPMGIRCVKVPQWRNWIAAGATSFAERVHAVAGSSA
jgi:2-keto-3-deoxy-L-rhamnonate aldolase RhmA